MSKTKVDWKEQLKNEFFVHFKDSPDEFQFLGVFIEDLLARQEDKTESEITEIIIKRMGLKVKDLPAFPPARMKVVDVIGLIMSIGLARQRKDERERVIEIVKESLAEKELQEQWKKLKAKLK